MDAILQSLRTEFDALLALTPRLVTALVVLLAFVLLGRLAGRGVERLLRSTGHAGRYLTVSRRLVGGVIVLLGGVAALHVLGLTAIATSLLATGGLMAVIFGFAFKEVGENLLAGVFLAFSRSFDIGDLIKSSDLTGVIREIDLRHVHIRTGDGCDIFIPSAEIFRNPLFNYTRDGLRRGSFTVGIDYGDDPHRARGVLLEAVRGIEHVLADPAPAVELAGFNAAYVEVEVFFWVDTFGSGPGLSRVRTMVMEACRQALREAGFTFSSDVSTAVSLAPVEVRRPEA